MVTASLDSKLTSEVDANNVSKNHSFNRPELTMPTMLTIHEIGFSLPSCVIRRQCQLVNSLPTHHDESVALWSEIRASKSSATCQTAFCESPRYSWVLQLRHQLPLSFWGLGFVVQLISDVVRVALSLWQTHLIRERGA